MTKSRHAAPMQGRTCVAVTADQKPCGMRPLRGEEFCFAHHPDLVESATDARRLGGLRRRRERAVATAYDLVSLDSPAEIRRLLQIAVLDALQLDNSIARSKLLIGAAGVAAKLLFQQRLGDRLSDVEDGLGMEPSGGRDHGS